MTDNQREAIALALINSDRAMAGLPPVASRENIPDSDGYLVNADAILSLIPSPQGDSGEVEILRRALAWHGDPQRMATTREEWQQVVDAAIVWVKANPEPDRPSFSSFANRPTQGDSDAMREAMAVGEKFLNACNSAWASGEPSHRVETMLNMADKFRVALDRIRALPSQSTGSGDHFATAGKAIGGA